MGYLLLIETSSTNCSVALALDEKILVERNHNEENVHAGLITILISEVLEDAQVSLNDVQTLVVGKGPGSYTGLRIGVATAKGICYALDKPLVACSSLQGMAQNFYSAEKEQQYLALIDARRMEVYAGQFNAKLQFTQEPTAVIVDEHSFIEFISAMPTIIMGSGAEKCKSFLQANSNAIFVNTAYPTAAGLLPEALHKIKIGEVENLAYFEPFYLKDFYFNK